MSCFDGRSAGLAWNYDRTEINRGWGSSFDRGQLRICRCHINRIRRKQFRTETRTRSPAYLCSRLTGDAWAFSRLQYVAGLRGEVPSSPLRSLGNLRIDRRNLHAVPRANKVGLTSSGLHIGIWSAAAIGVVLKLLLPGRFDRLSVILYLVLGWSGVIAYDAAVSALPTSTLWLIAAGGALYSTGLIFHLWQSLRFQNAIWHAFVVLAAVCHYIAVVNSVGLLSV
jgi:Haemolysin-III related